MTSADSRAFDDHLAIIEKKLMKLRSMLKQGVGPIPRTKFFDWAGTIGKIHVDLQDLTIRMALELEDEQP